MEVQQSEADPNHRVSFTDPQVYSEQTAARQAAFVDTILYAASSGLDDGGAYSAELALVILVHLPGACHLISSIQRKLPLWRKRFRYL
jgi:hypothetical protein